MWWGSLKPTQQRQVPQHAIAHGAQPGLREVARGLRQAVGQRTPRAEHLMQGGRRKHPQLTVRGRIQSDLQGADPAASSGNLPPACGGPRGAAPQPGGVRRPRWRRLFQLRQRRESRRREPPGRVQVSRRRFFRWPFAHGPYAPHRFAIRATASRQGFFRFAKTALPRLPALRQPAPVGRHLGRHRTG